MKYISFRQKLLITVIILALPFIAQAAGAGTVSSVFPLLSDRFLKSAELVDATDDLILKNEQIQAYLSARISEISVSEEEARTFYNENKEMVGGIPFEQVQETIQNFLAGHKKQEAINDHIDDLGRQHHLQINKQWMDTHYNRMKNNPDTLNVVFVQVHEHQILSSRFGIQSIPVQVFFDRSGNETFRHAGFFAEKDILIQLEKMGVVQ